MKESYSEIVAEYADPESYAGDGNIAGVATAGVHAGPEIELRHHAVSRAHTVKQVEGNIDPVVIGETGLGRGGVEGLEHVWKLQTREPGDPLGSLDVVRMARRRDGQRTSPRVMLT